MRHRSAKVWSESPCLSAQVNVLIKKTPKGSLMRLYLGINLGKFRERKKE